MYAIRPFNPCDNEFAALVELHNVIWPDSPSSVENWKYSYETRNPNFLRKRFVMEEDDEIVAWCSCWESVWEHVPGKYGVDVNVHPGHEGQGLKQALFEHTLDFLSAREPAPHTLSAETREDKSSMVQFLQNNGFDLAMRYPRSCLDVTDYDFSHYHGLAEKVAAKGADIVTLPQMQARDPQWMPHLYEGFCDILRDVPAVDPITPQPIEEFAKDFDAPGFCGDAWFLALDGVRPVGISTLWKDLAMPEKMHVGITGVVRSHRRQGIATALKLRTIEFAQQYGARLIETDNEENNPMYDLNMKLGFKPEPAWVEFRKEL